MIADQCIDKRSKKRTDAPRRRRTTRRGDGRAARRRICEETKPATTSVGQSLLIPPDHSPEGTANHKHNEKTHNHPKQRAETLKLPIDPKQTQGNNYIWLGRQDTLSNAPLAAEVLGDARTDQINVTGNRVRATAPGRRREHRRDADPTCCIR